MCLRHTIGSQSDSRDRHTWRVYSVKSASSGLRVFAAVFDCCCLEGRERVDWRPPVLTLRPEPVTSLLYDGLSFVKPELTSLAYDVSLAASAFSRSSFSHGDGLRPFLYYKPECLCYLKQSLWLWLAKFHINARPTVSSKLVDFNRIVRSQQLKAVKSW